MDDIKVTFDSTEDVSTTLDVGSIQYGQLEIGETITGETGEKASVTNTGSLSHAILNFTLPKGDKGEKGDKGDKGEKGDDGRIGVDGKQGEKGEKGDKGDKGDTGEQGIQGEKGDESYPIGTIVEYDGDTIPDGFELVEDKGEVYSTEEVRIGTWIDGKPLYRKTIVNNTIVNGGKDVENITPLDIENIDVAFLGGDSFYRDTKNNFTIGMSLINHYESINMHYVRTILSIANKQITSIIGAYVSSSYLVGVFNVYYTKTTD